MAIIWLTLLTLILCLVFTFSKYKQKYDLINKIPGPLAYPIIGNFLLLNGSAEQLWASIRKFNNQYYPITRYWLGPFPHISVSHPDDLEVVLSSCTNIEKGFPYECLKPWLNTGLLISSGCKWKRRRKILTRAFHFNVLKKYLDVINKQGKNFVKNFAKTDEQVSVDLMSLFTHFSLHITCESIMGVELNKIDTESAQEYKNAIFTMGKVIVYRTFRPFIQDWMLKSLTAIGKMQIDALKVLNRFTEKVLVERKSYHANNENIHLRDIDCEMSAEELIIGNRKSLAMLDLLIKAEKDGLIDNDGIKEELDTFMFAGHETTAVALTYAVILLAENSDIQDRARLEIERVFNISKGNIGASEIQELHYLERCIKESLRLFPVAPAITRCLSEGINLRGYTIPAGTEIGCYIFDVHRDPNFWPDPNKYDPERFLPECIKKRHPYSYIPFSAGPRNCIGQKFAIMELKCLLAHILYHFKLEPVTRSSKIEFALDMICRSSQPVYTKFVRIRQ